MNYRLKLPPTAAFAALLLTMPACDKDDGDGDEMTETGGHMTAHDESGHDAESGTAEGGDGDATGDGDGDSTGDGDGDATGDGDGDSGGAACGSDPGWGGTAVGTAVKHIAGLDHTGAMFNTCDIVGTPMALDLSTVWCGPCNTASDYLAGNHENDPFSGMGQQIRDVIANGNVKWITFITQDQAGSPATQAVGASWDAMYHNPNIPVVTEMDVHQLDANYGAGCVPAVYVVTPENTFLAVEDCQTWNQLQAMLQNYG